MFEEVEKFKNTKATRGGCIRVTAYDDPPRQ
jgi:hypothetical protein